MKAQRPTRTVTPEKIEFRKNMIKSQNKRRREYFASLSPEELEQYKRNKQYDRERRQEEKDNKKAEIQNKKDVKREIALLTYMLKNDTRYHHHGTSDDLSKEIKDAIEYAKQNTKWKVYNNYIWNYYGEGYNYMSLSLLGKLWQGKGEFETIYDVPLDGTYQFYSYDSGNRGLGSFHYITWKKKETEVNAPKVNPGGIIPITC